MGTPRRSALSMVVSIGLFVAAAREPAAQPVPDLPPQEIALELQRDLEIGAAPSWSWRLAEKMTLAGDELGLHLSRLTFDAVDLDFDGHKRIARLRLQAGESGKLAFGIESDVAFQKGYARVDATIHLALLGRHLAIALPDIDMVPRSTAGQRHVELRLPLIDLRF